jgi:hypothetical protein
MRLARLTLVMTTPLAACLALNTMHIGNSLTDHAYGMHTIAEARGHDDLMGRHMIPGAPVWWLWDHLAEGFWDPVWEDHDGNLTNYAWDALVLQAYRGEWTNDIDACRNYVNRVRSRNAACRVYVYAHHHSEQPGDFPGDWAANQDLTISQRTFEKIADTLSGLIGTPVYIVPNGNVLYRVYQDIGRGLVPTVSQWLDLFGGADDIHLNNKGAYICAVVHFATIYRENPVNATFQSVWNVSPDVSQAFAEYVWRVAWEVVTAYPRSGVTQVGVRSAAVRSAVRTTAASAGPLMTIDGRTARVPARSPGPGAAGVFISLQAGQARAVVR